MWRSLIAVLALLALSACSNFNVGPSQFTPLQSQMPVPQRFSVGVSVPSDSRLEAASNPSEAERALAEATRSWVRFYLSEDGILAADGDKNAAELRFNVCYSPGGVLSMRSCSQQPTFNFPAAPQDYAALSSLWQNGRAVSKERLPYYGIDSVARDPQTFAKEYARNLVDGIEKNLLHQAKEIPSGTPVIYEGASLRE